MKNITAAVLLVLFLGVACDCNVTADKEPVFDSDGDVVRSGVEYYIRALFSGPNNGWLDLGSPSNSSCPKFPIQSPNDSGMRRPVVFYPVNGTSGSLVYESTDLNIAFVPGIDPFCRTTTTWKIDDYDPSSGRWWVTTGGIQGNAGPQTLANWFKLEKINFSSVPDPRWYFIRFCPSVCESCSTPCSYVDRVYIESEKQIRWALKKDFWLFVFVKARSTAKIETFVGKLQSEE